MKDIHALQAATLAALKLTEPKCCYGTRSRPEDTREDLPTLLLATTLVVGTYRNRLQLGTFDQAQCNAEVM